jgi:hypothetical protein
MKRFNVKELRDHMFIYLFNFLFTLNVVICGWFVKEMKRFNVKELRDHMFIYLFNLLIYFIFTLFNDALSVSQTTCCRMKG